MKSGRVHREIPLRRVLALCRVPGLLSFPPNDLFRERWTARSMATEKMRSMQQEGRKVDTVEERVQQGRCFPWMPAASFDGFYRESWIPRVPIARLAPSMGPRSVIGPFQQDRRCPWDDFKQTSSPSKLLSAAILLYTPAPRCRLYVHGENDRRHSSDLSSRPIFTKFDYGENEIVTASRQAFDFYGTRIFSSTLRETLERGPCFRRFWSMSMWTFIRSDLNRR